MGWDGMGWDGEVGMEKWGGREGGKRRRKKRREGGGYLLGFFIFRTTILFPPYPAAPAPTPPPPPPSTTATPTSPTSPPAHYPISRSPHLQTKQTTTPISPPKTKSSNYFYFTNLEKSFDFPIYCTCFSSVYINSPLYLFFFFISSHIISYHIISLSLSLSRKINSVEVQKHRKSCGKQSLLLMRKFLRDEMGEGGVLWCLCS